MTCPASGPSRSQVTSAGILLTEFATHIVQRPIQRGFPWACSGLRKGPRYEGTYIFLVPLSFGWCARAAGIRSPLRRVYRLLLSEFTQAEPGRERIQR